MPHVAQNPELPLPCRFEKKGTTELTVITMWKKFCVALGAVAITGLAACVSAPGERDFRAYPDDYRYSPGEREVYSRPQGGDVVVRDRSYADDRHGDRDGDGVLNWRDRYPDDSRRF